MEKKLTISIVLVLLLVIASIAGSVYAYFSVAANSTNNTVRANSRKFDIVYTGGTHIDGQMKVVSSKEEGYNTTVQIGLAQDSVGATADLSIDIADLSTNLAITGFIWEVYRIENGAEVYVNDGNFSGYATGNSIPIVENYTLSTTPTSFKIYFWLDGDNTDNNVLGGRFEGYISAKSSSVTGTPIG